MLRRLVISPVMCRRKKSLKYRLKRKEMKDKDRYAISKTGENSLNPWLTKPRLQAMLKEMERLRNLHRHTIKYNKKLIDKFAKEAEEYSEFCSHRYFADYLEITNNENSLYEVKNEAKTLPKYLQEDLEKDTGKFELPLHLQFFPKYHPQISRILPPRLADNWRVSYNILEIMRKDPSISTGHNEEEED